MSSNPNLLLLGFGRFGEALADLALAADWGVRAFDPRGGVPDELAVNSVQELVAQPGLVLLAVPMESFRSVLEELRPLLNRSHTVVDVCSVKHAARAAMGELLGEEIPWVCSHPLFGPMSLELGERPLRVVLCPDTPHGDALERARTFYEAIGCVTTEQNSVDHDRSMADTHALAFFVAKGLLDIGAGDQEIVPPSFRAMAQAIESVRSDAGHLFFPIQHSNPFAPASRARLLRALESIHGELAGAGESPGGVEPSETLAIAPGQASPRELGEARASIDALDSELMRLLQRRARIALRAARAKAEHGRGVRDRPREEALLIKRRQLAEENGLEPRAVTEVFEAIMKFSRGEQRRWLDARDGGQDNS
ncbi:MAG: prephenate dehydrogenase [Candidatus Paceibacteria bacterium]|jgi:prephenate dehydrogenase